MERKNPRDITYQSKKILGQLYDLVERADFVPQYKNAPDERILGAYDLKEDILIQAAELKESYDAAIRRVMAQHSIRTEFEIWSTFVLEHNQESKDYKFHEELGNISRSIRDQYRDRCVKKAGGRDFAKLGPFVAAMYAVTARELAIAVAECAEKREVNGTQIPIRIMDAKHMPLISFPWLFYSELGKIAVGSSARTFEASDVVRAGDREGAIGMRQKTRLKQADYTSNNIVVKDELKVGEAVTYRGDLLELFDDASSTRPTEGLIGAQKTKGDYGEKQSPVVPHEQLSAREESLLDGLGTEWVEASRQISEYNSTLLSSTISNRAALLAQRDSVYADTRSVAQANTASRARRKTLAKNLLIDIDDEDPDGMLDDSKDNAGASDSNSRSCEASCSKPATLTIQTSVSTPSTSEPCSGSTFSFENSYGSKFSSLDGEATTKSEDKKITNEKEECVVKRAKMNHERKGRGQLECGEKGPPK